MAITVNYTDVADLLQLATNVGKEKQWQQNAALDMQLMSMAQANQARQQAMRLQEAAQLQTMRTNAARSTPIQISQPRQPQSPLVQDVAKRAMLNSFVSSRPDVTNEDRQFLEQVVRDPGVNLSGMMSAARQVLAQKPRTITPGQELTNQRVEANRAASEAKAQRALELRFLEQKESDLSRELRTLTGGDPERFSQQAEKDKLEQLRTEMNNRLWPGMPSDAAVRKRYVDQFDEFRRNQDRTMALVQQLEQVRQQQVALIQQGRAPTGQFGAPGTAAGSPSMDQVTTIPMTREAFDRLLPGMLYQYSGDPVVRQKQ